MPISEVMATVLVADDHPLTREALASLLAQHGFDVVGEASDGHEAIVAMVSLGLGIGIAPELVISASGMAASVRRIPAMAGSSRHD